MGKRWGDNLTTITTTTTLSIIYRIAPRQLREDPLALGLNVWKLKIDGNSWQKVVKYTVYGISCHVHYLPKGLN